MVQNWVVRRRPPRVSLQQVFVVSAEGEGQERRAGSGEF